MKYFFVVILNSFAALSFSQNLGIGTTTPTQKLEVNGNIKTNGLILNNAGNPFDFLMKLNAEGQIGFKKGYGGTGVRYIICVDPGFAIPDPATQKEGPFVSEIKIWMGSFIPPGWMPCEGQSLARLSYTALYNQIGTTYGAPTITTFSLPDLRAAVPVGAGTSWLRGQKTN